LKVDETQIPLSETLTILDFLCQPYPQRMKQCKGEIAPEQFLSTYKAAQEKTSSSYSGRHVGNHKVIKEDLLLVKLHSDMMSIPYITGFSPQRWHQVVDVMLEKDPGYPKQHRLRIVALLESDCNQSQRILVARWLTHHLEDFQMIPDMQCRSCPSKMCISPVINKVLSYDLVHQTKVNGAFIENGAVGYYDRLVNSLVFLELWHLGIPMTVLKSIQNSWNQARHHIKTRYGYSSCTYSNTEELPLFGPGQGSATGPNLWRILFCLIAKNLLTEELAIH